MHEKTWQQTISRLLAEEQRKQKDRATKFIAWERNLFVHRRIRGTVMPICNPYLLRPLRTFRQAFSDIAASHPELIPPGIDVHAVEKYAVYDYTLAIKNKGRPPKPWRWEIYTAGRASRCDNLNFSKRCPKLLEWARWHWRNSGPSEPLDCGRWAALSLHLPRCSAMSIVKRNGFVAQRAAVVANCPNAISDAKHRRRQAAQTADRGQQR